VPYHHFSTSIRHCTIIVLLVLGICDTTRCLFVHILCHIFLLAAHKYDTYKNHKGSDLHLLLFHYQLWQSIIFSLHYFSSLKKINSTQKKALNYTSIKCSLNKFCKNDYELALNVNKIIFEGYGCWEKIRRPPLNQKFFQNVLEQSVCSAK